MKPYEFRLGGQFRAGAAPVDVTAEMLQAGIEARLAACRELEFEYAVTEEISRAPDANAEARDAFGGPLTEGVQKTKNVFKILSAEPGKSRPWRFWQRNIDSREGKWVCERFVVFNGAQSRRFLREERVAEGKWNNAFVTSFEMSDCFQSDVFESFLCLGLRGPDSVFMHGMDLPADHAYAIEEKTEGKTPAIWKLSATLPAADVKYVVEVSGAPEFLVRSFNVEYKRKPQMSFEVTQVKTFDGVPYPAAGKFRQWPLGYLNGQKYEFEVTSAARLTEKDRAEWLPIWPPGTIVVDAIQNKNITIDREVKEVTQALLERRRKELAESTVSHGRPLHVKLLLVANAVAVAALLIMYFSKWQRRRAV